MPIHLECVLPSPSYRSQTQPGGDWVVALRLPGFGETPIFPCQRAGGCPRVSQNRQPSGLRKVTASASAWSPSARRGHRRDWTPGRDKKPERTPSHPQGVKLPLPWLRSASCLIHLKQQKGGAGSQHRPLDGKLLDNSRMWDSQKETQTGTSCGCKIPRCQELKIAAPGAPGKGKGHACCGGAEAEGRPCGFCISLLLPATQLRSLRAWASRFGLTEAFVRAGLRPRPLTWEPPPPRPALPFLPAWWSLL